MKEINKNKNILDVYYYINFEEGLGFIEECLRLQLKINQNTYELNKFTNCKNIINSYEPYRSNKIDCKEDVVKNGFIIFNNMFEKLKLKNNTETWFIYISNGNIKNLFKDVFVVLLNKIPSEKKSFYVINKNNVIIKKDNANGTSAEAELQSRQGKSTDLARNLKLSNIKIVNGTISEIFRCEKFITYTNLD